MLFRTLMKGDTIEKARKRCKRKFVYYFKNGYRDEKYLSWERQYKLDAHEQFQKELNKKAFKKLLKNANYSHIASIAVRIESRTNLLFSFEKMALRDAVKSDEGAEIFAKGLYDYIYGDKNLENRFENFVLAVSLLPRKQTRVLTWPLVTVFGFLANPAEHIFLKPRVTQAAAVKYKFGFAYNSKPNWHTYHNLLDFADTVWAYTEEYGPRDYIDIQSFIWVMGSEEYPD